MSDDSASHADSATAETPSLQPANDDAIPTAALETLREWSCTPEIVAIIEGAARALEELTRREAA